LIKVIS